MNEQIGEVAERRHAAPIASMALWAIICGIALIIVHALTVDVGTRLGSYWTGLITLIIFLIVSLYSARKRTLWWSVRWLRLAMRFPRRLAIRFLVFDRLETWRFVHITVGIFALLPFWWHVQGDRASTLEIVLEITVVTLVISGLFGTAVQDLLPRAMRLQRDLEVRLEDVEADFNALYVEAEEAVLGHSEQLVNAYVQNVRPLLTGNQSGWKMLWATLTGSDPAPAICDNLRRMAGGLEGETETYGKLLDIAERKIRLEHNRFNLQFGTGWLRFHLGLAALTGLLVIFHVAGVLYFAGL